MLAYTVRRFGWSIALCLILSLITFVIFYIVPRQGQVPRLQGSFTDVQRAEQFSGPVVVQYARWVEGVAHGSLGRSYVSRRPVSEILLGAAPVTLSLTLGGAVIWLLVSFPLGILSAVRPRSLVDRGATMLVLFGLSVHPVWLGLVLSFVLGYQLHLVPFAGYCDMFHSETACGGPVQWFTHLLLPWVTFAIVFAALYVRMIRASVIETIQEDYVRLARAKGITEWAAMRRHVLPNACCPSWRCSRWTSVASRCPRPSSWRPPSAYRGSGGCFGTRWSATTCP